MADVLRIGNCSGFYGDRLAAMREMLEGGELDVLTGDYLAELTMLILGKDTMKDPSLGYARTFVRQAEDCLGLALERGVRLVTNAGGLNPAGLADRVREIASGLGLACTVAHVHGDDLRAQAAELGFAGSLTANAYLGGFGIARGLARGADVVVTGRVTDASLVVGPCIAHFGWEAEDWHALAGAVVAGHVLECGTQATGGNFSGFGSLPNRHRPLGFPLANVSADGSSVISKHPGTGGAVTLDTVTAQLMYEIQGPSYLGPDVTTDLTSVHLHEIEPDRVAISGVRGTAPPEQLKVCVNELGGFRNSVEFVLTGLELEEKAAWVRSQLEASWGSLAPESVTWTITPWPTVDASTQEGASCLLRCTVRDPSAQLAGKGLTAPAVELALGSYPGFTMTAPPTPATPYGIYRARYVDRSVVTHTVGVGDVASGESFVIPDPTHLAGPAAAEPAPEPAYVSAVPTQKIPLGTFVHARSGDKGGDANLGLWVAHDEHPARDQRIAWLLGFITPERIRELAPEAAELEIEVHPLTNLSGVNVLLRGLLGEGVAASVRFDPQAKALGEWVRSRLVDVPEELL